MHPYEVDTGELAEIKKLYNNIPKKWFITQFVRRGAVPSKLRKLLTDFKFSSFEKTYYAECSSIKKKNETEKSLISSTLIGNLIATG